MRYDLVKLETCERVLVSLSQNSHLMTSHTQYASSAPIKQETNNSMINTITTDMEVLMMNDNEYCERMLLHSLEEKPHDNSFSTALSESTSSLMEDEILEDDEHLHIKQDEEKYETTSPTKVTPEKYSSTIIKSEMGASDDTTTAADCDTEAPSNNVGIPGKFDVLCGQSRICANHTGNRRFQIVLDIYAPKYDAATSKQEKMTFTKEIVAGIEASGGRFLKYKDGLWQEISTVTARDKVSHALRTKVTSWKRQQQQQQQQQQALEKGSDGSPAKRPSSKKRASSHKRRSSSSSITTTASDIVTTSFDGNDPTSSSLVEDLLKTQREIFAGLQKESESNKVHPLKRGR